jgi:LysR family transcriptional regulator for bpeEF and oprC
VDVRLVGALDLSSGEQLRVFCGRAESQFVPAISDFVSRYPDIQLVLSLNNRVVDLVEEGIDVAIRAGELADSTLIARRLGTLRWATCAAPSYLREHGTPKSPQALESHRCLV